MVPWTAWRPPYRTNRASHCRLPSHAMRVLAAAAALPIVAAGRWECPAGSISGSHGIAACCPAACGHCGGRGCEERAGGREACCAIDIQKAGRPCAGTAPPCVPQGRVGIDEVPIRTRRFRQNLIKDLLAKLEAKGCPDVTDSCSVPLASKLKCWEALHKKFTTHKNTLPAQRKEGEEDIEFLKTEIF